MASKLVHDNSKGRRAPTRLKTHVVLGGKHLQRGLDNSSSEPQDQVEGRLLLDVVVGKGSAILELLSGKDQSLLIRGDTLLVLDLCG